MHDKYHAHEALDRCSLAIGFIADNLVGHPFVVDHPGVSTAIDAALSILHGAYQEIGGLTSSTTVLPPTVSGRDSQYDTGSGTTPGMWEMVNDALDGALLPLPITNVVHALSDGRASVHLDDVHPQVGV